MRRFSQLRGLLQRRLRTIRRRYPALRRLRSGLRLRSARAPRLPGWPESLHDNVRHFTAAGPAFEAACVSSIDDAPRKARVIAFYLPQFHAFPENDRWWGDGFTEWRNVARGLPRFAGHYQPRIPRDLGHTDLDNTETLRAQAALATASGIDAFCFYYYWFDGKRLMQRPLERFIEAGIEQSFCIMWANENWTRRWDGRERDVLIRQRYRAEDEAAFIEDTARYLEHPRYVRVDGRPLFIIYRAADLPDARVTIDRWRLLWQRRLGVTPWVLMAQTYDDRDPRPDGFDGAIEFPPHKVSRDLVDRTEEHRVLDPGFSGQIRAYGDVVSRALEESVPPWPQIKTVSPHWDNDARREGRGVTFHGSTPALYERWLSGAVDFARAQPFGGEPLVFVNAWNEWAEGACLEPDVHYGHACLNATRRVVAGSASTPRARRLLLVGHDAHANGAQMLLLALARHYVEERGYEITIVLGGEGSLLSRYRSLAPTHVIDLVAARSERNALRDFLDREAFPMAICNTTVSGVLVPPLRTSGTRVVALVHEMPVLLGERKLRAAAIDLAGTADAVVFPADSVREGFDGFAATPSGEIRVRPQGLYKRSDASVDARAALRRRLGLGPRTPLVLNAGYADRRKGFDLFVRTAVALRGQMDDVCCVWVGKRAPDMQRWIDETDGVSQSMPGLHLEPFADDLSDWYAAADCLFLSSREDPFPTVALEAMSVGLPVVSFTGATGLDALQQQFGALVPEQDPTDAAREIVDVLAADDDAIRTARSAHVDRHFRFDDYADFLLDLLDAGA